MILMICVTGAHRLGEWVCRGLALHGDGWASWQIENLGNGIAVIGVVIVVF